MAKVGFSAQGLTGEVYSTAERTTLLRLRPARDAAIPKRTLKGKPGLYRIGRFQCIIL
jgi:hypothetical protein